MNYYYVINGLTLGPIDEASLIQMAQQGIINQGTPTIAEGQQQWSTYGELFASSVSAPPASFAPLQYAQGIRPITYRARAVSNLMRFCSDGNFGGFSVSTQMEEITFYGNQIHIKWRDGKACDLVQGEFTATCDPIYYTIRINTFDGRYFEIRGSDAELPDAVWQEIMTRLNCSNL